MMGEQLPIKPPEAGKPVKAVLRHFHTRGEVTYDLIHVNEPDCTWRTCDDNSEIAHEWDVVSWEYR